MSEKRVRTGRSTAPPVKGLNSVKGADLPKHLYFFCATTITPERLQTQSGNIGKVAEEWDREQSHTRNKSRASP